MPKQSSSGANFYARFNNSQSTTDWTVINGKNYAPGLLKEIYRKMLVVRMFEEAAERYVYEGKTFGSIHVSIGQEATSVGAGAALKKEDYITGTHRSHGHPIAKGAKLGPLMAETLGKETGIARGHGGTMHLADFSVGCLGETSIVGSGIPVATGAGLAIKNRKTDQVCLCYFGDGAACEGSFHEAVNYGAIWKLPVIYFCENNGVAITTVTDYSIAGGSIAARAAGYGIPGVTVDGQDVLAVYEVVKEAVTRARSGEGPTLIEAKTIRFREHAIGLVSGFEYRDKEAHEKAMIERDPILLFEKVLKDSKVLDENGLEEVKSAARKEVDAACKFAEESPEPDFKNAFDALYRNPIFIDTKF
ncbi:MAG: thiamine pyrophosphate-dependent dehydrogenase E1 component subunit alpha [Synergistaceae bacterium]|nr:thiamine pyrophosphate-dependent dehydrogenase E1 component subunit alpha [Synergistaceae bacterium]